MFSNTWNRKRMRKRKRKRRNDKHSKEQIEDGSQQQIDEKSSSVIAQQSAFFCEMPSQSPFHFGMTDRADVTIRRSILLPSSLHSNGTMSANCDWNIY